MTKHKEIACQTDLLGFQIDFLFDHLNLRQLVSQNVDGSTQKKDEASPHLKPSNRGAQNSEIIQKEEQSETRVLSQIEEEYSRSRAKYINNMLDNFHRITGRISRERREYQTNRNGFSLEDQKQKFRKKNFIESQKRGSSPNNQSSKLPSYKNLNSERVYKDDESDRILCQLEEEFSLSKTKYFTNMLENFHRKTNLISKEKKEQQGTACFLSKIGARSLNHSENQKSKFRRTMNFQETYSEFREKLSEQILR